jgi:hypothetical protein
VTSEASRSGDRLGVLGLFLLPAIIIAGGYAAQANTFLNHDVGWVLYSTGRLLDGAVFGVDIVEPNPPLIWWISAGPVLVAERFALPVWAVFRVFALLLLTISLLVSDRLLAAGGVARTTRMAFLAAGAYLLTFAVHRDFGQREHLAVILILPYLLAVALRIGGGTIDTARAVAIGIAAGLAVALKPYFLGVPILVEVIILLKMRSLRLLVRPEALGAIFAVSSYALAVILFASPWLTNAAPDILRIYWAFEVDASKQFVPLLKRFYLVLIGAFIVFRSKPNPYAIVTLAAAAGFALSVVLQGKYYSYHIYPAYALLVIALTVSTDSMARKWKLPMIAILLVVLVQDLVFSGQKLVTRSSHGAIGRGYAEMATFVRSNTPEGGSFLAISTHPYPGFPTALYANRRWSSARNSQFYLPAVVRLREQGPRHDRELLVFAEAKARAAIASDLANKPALVLIDQSLFRHAIEGSKFDYLKFFMEDPKFASRWSEYVPAPAPPRGFAAFVRRKD